jgi:SAM-dependent methyltransferase
VAHPDETVTVELNKAYWDDFYTRNHIMTPSQFCVSVCTDIPESSTILELGSGSGRDALFFARCGHNVVGVDLSKSAIQSCNAKASEMGLRHIEFVQGDLGKPSDISAAHSLARNIVGENGTLIFFSRFVMHSLDEQQEDQLFAALKDCLSPGDLMYFEFRSKEDEHQPKHYGGHYRRFVDSEKFIEKMRQFLGCEIEYVRVGQGMAKYKDEDPFVCRIIAKK